MRPLLISALTGALALVAGCVSYQDVTSLRLARYTQIQDKTFQVRAPVFLIEDRDTYRLRLYPPDHPQDTPIGIDGFHGSPVRCALGDHTFIVDIIPAGTHVRIDTIVQKQHFENGPTDMVYGTLRDGPHARKNVRVDSLLLPTRPTASAGATVGPNPRYLDLPPCPSP